MSAKDLYGAIFFTVGCPQRISKGENFMKTLKMEPVQLLTKCVLL